MAAGKKSTRLAMLEIDSVEFDDTACLQGFTLNWSVQENTYFCSGTMKGEPGVHDRTISGQVILDADDTAALAKLTPGYVYTDLKAYPAGDTIGNIGGTSTDGYVQAAPRSAQRGGLYTIDLTIRLNNYTEAAIA
jgi:hypothetical protein